MENMTTLVIYCQGCGAVYNVDLLKRIQQAAFDEVALCPVCRGKYSGFLHKTFELVSLYEGFMREKDFCFGVEGIYVNANGFGNSRFIVRFADNYVINRRLPQAVSLPPFSCNAYPVTFTVPLLFIWPLVPYIALISSRS
jgi:hypothetical protein